MTKAIYPGKFDPLTVGHVDIIRRASRIFKELEVVIMDAPNDPATFSVAKRIKMMELVIKELPNVSVTVGDGLSVEFAKRRNAGILLRGIRAVMDYEHELQQATANMILAPQIETVFLLTRPEHSFMSSSAVKQIALNHGDLTKFVPKEILPIIMAEFDKVSRQFFYVYAQKQPW
jgi:pantetheine-phosphate adenylyltransferase